MGYQLKVGSRRLRNWMPNSLDLEVVLLSLQHSNILGQTLHKLVSRRLSYLHVVATLAVQALVPYSSLAHNLMAHMPMMTGQGRRMSRV
ncbi:hypothetical protein BDQ12DRAFT_677320 [Crucibulum laeve]|uniref:Uncharacterized protein n=1 Tax=Crucibulum laeve TaxID=68775 RepID=A0A5C3M909_9AGAR|nr:hypothetical protein BDQ12DRAFT_677320 [Crucibulum laeve]